MSRLVLVLTGVLLAACPARQDGVVPGAAPVVADPQVAPPAEPAPEVEPSALSTDPEGAQAPVAVPASLPVSPAGEAPSAATDTPEALYAACRDRVEGTERGGECASDTDCVRAGCSSEVCVAVAESGAVVTPCEVKSCFGVLEACGCHEGRCTWTLKAQADPFQGRPLRRVQPAENH